MLGLDSKPHYREQALVHLKTFGKLLDWFGPFEIVDPKTYKSKPSLLAKVRNTIF